MDTIRPGEPKDGARLPAPRGRRATTSSRPGTRWACAPPAATTRSSKGRSCRTATSPASCPPGWPGADPFVLGIFAWAEPTFASIYIGLAERALELAVAGAEEEDLDGAGRAGHGLQPDDPVRHRRDGASSWRASPPTSSASRPTGPPASITAWPGRPSSSRPSTRRSRGPSASSTWPWTSRAEAGCSRSNELERIYRDVRCGGFHPANSAVVHEIVGKGLLGVLGRARAGEVRRQRLADHATRRPSKP